MPTAKPLTAGVRVRLKQPLSSDPSNECGIVTRLDARGVLLKLDSGRELLVEPAMVDAID